VFYRRFFGFALIVVARLTMSATRVDDRNHVAIDFGTSGTACAYSLGAKSDKTYPLAWPDGQGISHKTATVVLLVNTSRNANDKDNDNTSSKSKSKSNTDKYEAISFGDGASKLYSDLLAKHDPRVSILRAASEPQWIFCDRIKMSLYRQVSTFSSPSPCGGLRGMRRVSNRRTQRY